LPQLKTVLRVIESGPISIDEYGCGNVGGQAEQAMSFWQQVNSAPSNSRIVASRPDDAAFLLYTSGTTGPPKGALIPQRALLGNLTGFECSHNGFPQVNDVVFTPADWAWTGGLLDGLIPAWYYGVPVVAYDYKKFIAKNVLALMARHRVTCAFIPPTALKMIRNDPASLARYDLTLRSIMSAGETVGEALYQWGLSTLNVPINEMCGQTEHNYVMGNCSRMLCVKPGSMGKAYPGHRVAIMNADGISSAGYRIGPGEIENCALGHEAVLQVAAIGVPDPDGLRGDVVKLCVVLRDEFITKHPPEKAELKASLQAHIREHLAAYEYPRLIHFYHELPMTTTGKVQRNVLRRLHKEENPSV